MLTLSENQFSSIYDPANADPGVLPPDFFEMDHSAWDCFVYVLEDNARIGICRWKTENGISVLDYFITVPEWKTRKVLFHTAALLINRIIVRDHPERILYKGSDAETIRALKHNLFFPKGKVLQRLVEGYRYAVKDSVFDSEGYIIHQGLTEVLPFGFFSSRDKGCGWIAAYNILKMNGMERTMFECADEIGSDDFLGELFGHSIYGLYAWLKKQGLDVHMTHMVKEMCLQRIKSSACGIFLYFHRRGSHFVAYRKVGDNLFRFYNAVYGRDNLEMSVEEFTKVYTVSPVSNLIWMDELKEL